VFIVTEFVVHGWTISVRILDGIEGLMDV